jgi:multiple sugar transport system ATP-binding protein
MVFQSYALYPHMSVYDNMAFGLENLGVAKSIIESKVNAAATLLQLAPLLQRKPTQLSGGQRQRVAIGRSIVREPKLFLFDEPLSNLDAELRVSMRAEIRDLHARLGATMIYVTHDQVEAMTMADKIVVLRAGRIEQVGSPLELYNRPCNQFVAGFIGSPRMNFVPAAEMPGAKAGAQTVGIRPEHAQLSNDGPLQLQVSQVEQLGSTSILHGKVVADAPFELILSGQTSIKRGDTVRVSAPAGQLHYFDQNGLRL